MPTIQKSDVRPISFLLHDLRGKAAATEVKLTIRPEELTRTDTSRLSVHQTFGGAWADNFGPGVPAVVLAGHTGWGGGVRANGVGGMPDGFEAFQKLHSTIFDKWHSLRDEAVRAGDDPDQIKLIFADMLDGFTWTVLPQVFVLRRNKARPLLSQYQITMVKQGDRIEKKSDGGSVKAPGDAMENGLASLNASIKKINEFSSNLRGQVAAAIGPVSQSLKQYVDLSKNVLTTVHDAVSAGQNLVRAPLGPLVDVAHDVSQGAFNVISAISAAKSLPTVMQAEFMRASGAYANAFCLMKNVFRVQEIYPEYSALYGASVCSSTNGGRPISAYADRSANAFSDIVSVDTQKIAITGVGKSALSEMSRIDAVKAPPSMSELSSMLDRARLGVRVL